LLASLEKPEDWQSADVTAKLYRSLPGVFDIEKLRPKLQDATTFLEVNASSTLEDEVPSATAAKPAENTKPRPALVHFPYLDLRAALPTSAPCG
jgi:hypothetical protein